jgi:hypothetical protein
MDRSFLSRPEVITASRSFVCIRLTTYEDENETKFCRSLFAGRSGEVENTTFAILSPDGKTTLSRPGRGTRGAFRDAADLAQRMNTIAARHTPRKDAEGQPALPVTLTARLGINVAASDGQLLVVVLAKDSKVRKTLESRVALAAWSKPFLGRLTYASASSAAELKGVEGVREEDGVLVISPDTFGQKGKVLRQVAGTSQADIEAALRTALTAHKRRTKDMRTHRADGIEAGAFWEPRLPVTDPQELAQSSGSNRTGNRRSARYRGAGLASNRGQNRSGTHTP